MEESEDNMSAEEIKFGDVPIKVKPKKRSLVERELETSLTARVTSPLTNGDATTTSRYGRARRIKSSSEFCDLEKSAPKLHKSPKLDKSPSKVQSPAYKMHASNSPVRIETPKRDSSLENQIENIFNENISLSRFGSEEKACKSASKKFPKVYIRKDLIQSKDKEDDTVVLIKNIFSPSKSATKSNTHLSNYLERSSEKYNMKEKSSVKYNMKQNSSDMKQNSSEKYNLKDRSTEKYNMRKPINGYMNTSSVVKTLDFDSKKKRKEEKKTVLSKSELFDLEAQCEYQVGDLAWARMGTYPFWPCIITRDPLSGMFVKKKLFGRIERDVLHVTFFGDNGRRGWIVGTMLRKFLGQTEFEAARANFPPEAKKKDPRLHAAFFISEKKMSQWQISVDEAEMLLKEPKRLRIDILNDMLQNVKEIRTTPKHEKSKTIVRTNSDVSLSESLLDTLFSEDDSKGNDADRSRSKSRNRSFDVSEVVTACLDNMAAKTGITKIQRQSHMDRWLQKAKSKTPEKSHLRSLSLKIEKDSKVSNTAKFKRKVPKKSTPNKPYNFRKIVTESQSEYKLLSHQNEHDYSLSAREINEPILLDDIEIEYENAEMLTSDVIEPGSGLGVIFKVETLFGKEQADISNQNDVIMTVINDAFTISDANDIQNVEVENQICMQNGHGLSDVDRELVLEKGNDEHTNESVVMETNNINELKLIETIESKDTGKYENNVALSIKDSDVVTLKDSDGTDNQNMDARELNTQTTNNISDNDVVTIVDHNNTLMHVEIQSGTATDEQSGFESNVQDTKSKIDKETHLHNGNELTKSLTPDIISNSFDKNIFGKANPEKDSVLLENMSQNNVLESNIRNEVNKLPNIITLKDDGIEDFPDVSIKIVDKDTLTQPSVMKEKLLQNKELDLNNCGENKTTNLNTQSPEKFDVLSMKEYVDDGIEDFPDISKNTRENTTEYTTPNLFLNELNSNTSTKSKTTDLSTQNLEVPYVVNVNEYVDDGIEEDFPSEPENPKQLTITKESLLSNKKNKSNSKTGLSTVSSEVSNFVTLKKYAKEIIEVLPNKSTNILDKSNLEQIAPDKQTVTKDNLALNKELNSNNSTGSKLTSFISCSEVSNIVNLKEYIDDGIKDFSDLPKNINEKPLTEHVTPNKETIIKVNKEFKSKSSSENRPTSPSTRSLEIPNFGNLKKSADHGIEDFPEVSKNIKEKPLTAHRTPNKATIIKMNKNLNSISSAENKPTSSGTRSLKVSNFVNLKEYADDGIEDFPDISKNIVEKPVPEHGTPNKGTITKINKDLNSKSRAENKSTSLSTRRLKGSKFVDLKECTDNGIEDFSNTSKINVEKTTEQVYKDNVVKKNLLQNKELESNSSNIKYKTANRSIKSTKVSNVINSKKYVDEHKDFPDVPTRNGGKNLILESKSLRQNDRELKEFETQLYNIFGLSNKKSPISNSNLSLNKSCNFLNSTDVVKTIDKVILIDSDDEPECTQKNANKKVIFGSKNENALVNVIEIGSAERETCTQKEQSKDVLVNIKNELMTKEKSSLQNLVSITENNATKETKSQYVDKDNLSVETQKKNASNNTKESAVESDTEKELIIVDIAETSIDEDDNESVQINAVSPEVNETSLQTILSTDHKLSYDTREYLKNPDFIKYLELRLDALMDEQPELTELEVTDYLYKTWLYQESLKTDDTIKKTDDTEKKPDDTQNTGLVNGTKHSPIKIKLSLNKSSKKNRKSYKVQITNDNENNGNPSVSIFDEKIKTDSNNININKKDNCVNQTKSSPKRSKRIKRNNNYSFQQYFLSSVKKDSFSNNILELIPKECNVDEKDNCQIKIEIDGKKDDTCKEATVSSKSPIQNGFKNVQIDKKLHSFNKTNCVEKLSPKIGDLTTENVGHEGEPNPRRVSSDGCDAEGLLAAHQLQITISKNQSACIADGDIIMNNTTDVKEEAGESDTDNKSVKSENNELCAKDKLSSDTKKPLEEPEFLQYLELQQDTLADEHPELTEEEIRNYLYNTWLYEEKLKDDIKKADGIEPVTNLVRSPKLKDVAPGKRARKKKVEKDKQIDFSINSEDMTRKEKSKRKIIKPYFYRENFSDIEDDIEFFEIFKPTSKTPTPVSALTETINAEGTEEQSSDIEMTDVEVEFAATEIDEVEEYFRQLTVPKPNLFKGLLREKVCEICEKVDNLIKCKGCHCMFHVDCVRKKPEVVEAVTTVRGRKKKRKSRGRKAKEHSNSLDSECQSDERSQDLNASDEAHNTSIENEAEPIVIGNADDFEAQLVVKMKELLDNPESKEYESFSSADELDWDDIDYGECKIVDVLPRKKDREVDIDHANFKCSNCEKYDSPVCFVCKSAVSPKDKAEHRQKCQVAHCHKYYHLECLDHWPQTQFVAGELSRINNSSQLVEALTCPRHVCHTCVCDDPRGCKTRFSGDKLARCVRCPATYHTFTKCLPAGTQILTASHIICPRHYDHRPGKVPCHVNTGWCFICALGGTLICCEYCPTSFHAECLNIDPPEGGYMCEDCETGRLPLYGEMVWVKLGHYRWWPGMILHPSEIPQNILAVKHSQGEFVVRFFGQYDYYWVNRGRVFPFQEGDSGRISTQRTKIDAAFTMAIEHAQRACEILKTASPNDEESMDIASSLLPPHYVKLKVNKPCGSLCGKRIDIEESSLTQCECDPNELDPCGPYTQCLNRMLLTECGPTCRAGDRCNNRAFEKRLYPKLTPYRTPHRGWGLKTLEDIKAGQFVIEYVGELIDEEEFRRRMRRKHEVRDENFYYLTLDKERMIDAGPKGNLARFMNHSCEPNCETQKWTVLGDVRVGLFALYDIPANSELTFNYNLESTGIEKKQCMCGAKRCSGYIGEKPKQDDQPKKNKPGLPTKRTYKKRKNVEISPSPKPKQRVPRPYKPRELTEIEKDLLIIKSATNGVSSDSESSRLSIDSKDSRSMKRKRTEDSLSPSTKKTKTDKLLEVTQDSDAKYQEVLTEKISI
ncbi:uncharacterized protein LOC123877669 [Maniola jurtina]|uniref:uncharacterized protein LOC123877669 n=1 Tax=Maniola jurtina TaxID=191418 RepID=UPI001E68E400|nr:uncharacterized protein LOC123877669 [Maniola jurtina]XP_045780469.1 uncharacterized protein LOC123877669 [Maniola jurtina]